MIWLSLGILVITFIIYKIIRSHNQWTTRGVKQIKETIFLGFFGDLLFRRKTLFDIVKDIHNAYAEKGDYNHYFNYLVFTIRCVHCTQMFLNSLASYININ